MKRSLLVLFAFALSISFAQDLITTFTGSSIESIEIVGDDLYAISPSSLFRVDLTSSTPTPTLIMNFGSSVVLYDLTSNNNILYISEQTNGTIWSLDTTNPSAVPQMFFQSSGFTARGLGFIGSTMYISDGGFDDVVSIDINVSPTATTQVFDYMNSDGVLEGLTADNQFVYFVDNNSVDGNVVYRIDPNAGSVSSTLTEIYRNSNFISYDIGVSNNKLYAVRQSNGDIVEIDLNNGNSEHVISLNSGISAFEGIAFSDDDLYFTNASSLYRLNDVLSTTESNLSKSELQVFPNPVESTIHIKSKEEVSIYYILDFSGKMIEKGEIIESEINVSGLNSGTYILLLENGEETKFIKK